MSLLEHTLRESLRERLHRDPRVGPLSDDELETLHFKLTGRWPDHVPDSPLPVDALRELNDLCVSCGI